MARRRQRQVWDSGETDAYVRSIALDRDGVPSFDRYPFSIPAVRALDVLKLHPNVTFLVGENGSGKSTLIEAIAMCVGFNVEGGSMHLRFSTRRSESELYEHLRLTRGAVRPRDGFFLRAESYYNVGTELEQIGEMDGYGGSIHEQSHGESFLALVRERFGGHGLYLLDEPESALSPSRQLSLLSLIHDLVVRRMSQLVIATHSPILMAYPHARILHLGEKGIVEVAYEETEHYRITRDFLESPESFLKHLLA